MKLKEAKAKQVWNLFEALSLIPRPSKQEEKVCDWLEGLASQYQREIMRDEVGNIVITIPATSGYENAPGVVIQAHTDMVCEKMPDKEHDFTKDPIRLKEKEGWVWADGTTLGADNGIGLCMGLSLLEEKDLPHAQIELLCTVDEETGLTGANSLQPGFVTGSRLINLDTEEEGVFTVGCAGGEQTDIMLPLAWQAPPPGFVFYQLKVAGLTGGHSGVNIHLQRANAICLTGACLNRMAVGSEVHLADLTGGNAHNAIARDARATVCLSPATAETLKKRVQSFENEIRTVFGQSDPDLAVHFEPVEIESQIIRADMVYRIYRLLHGLPHGVDRISTEYDGIVETSCNLAEVKINCDENFLHIVTSHRSFNPASQDLLTGRICALAEMAGARVTNSNSYPAWQPRVESELQKICGNLYQSLRGKPPVIEVIHAGLECGIIGDKHPGMDMISFGATIEDLHSPTERVNIESVDKVWAFLLKLLPELK